MMQWVITGLLVYHLITFLELFHLPPLSTWSKDASTSGFCNSSLQDPNPSRGLDLCSSSCQPCFPRTGHHPTAAAQMAGACYIWGLPHNVSSFRELWREFAPRISLLTVSVPQIGHCYLMIAKHPSWESLNHLESFLNLTSIAGLLLLIN